MRGEQVGEIANSGLMSNQGHAYQGQQMLFLIFDTALGSLSTVYQEEQISCKCVLPVCALSQQLYM